MAQPRFSAAARRDLDSIYDRSVAEFGQASADRYAAMLTATAKAQFAVIFGERFIRAMAA